MGAKTRTELIAGVRRKLSEASANEHSDTAITSALDEALIGLWALAREVDEGFCWGYTTAQDIVSGTYAYTLPSGVFGVARVEVLLGSVWVPVRTKVALRVFDPGSAADQAWPPRKFALSATQIVFMPTPGSSVTGGLRLLAKLDATKFTTAASTSGLPQDADEALEHGAAYRRLNDEGSQMWKDRYQLFQQAKADLLVTLTNRTPWVREVGLLDDDGSFLEND